MTQSLVSSSRPEIKLTVKLQTGLSGWRRKLPALFPPVVKPGECAWLRRKTWGAGCRVFIRPFACLFLSRSVCLLVWGWPPWRCSTACALAINGEARSVQTKALAHLLYTVSHCQSCRTPPAHRLPRYPRDYSCVCLFFSVCCHPDAVIVLEDRFLGHCAVIVTSDFKRVDSHFSSWSCVWKLL